MLAKLNSFPLFGLLLSLFCYAGALKLSQKYRSILLNPVLISTCIIACFLLFSGYSADHFKEGSFIITLFLPLATTALGYVVYRQYAYLKKNVLSILGGCFAAAMTSIISSYVLSKYVFNLNNELVLSLVPKSATLPIALDVLETLTANWGGGLV
jgi:putative effector of murein hydrolase